MKRKNETEIERFKMIVKNIKSFYSSPVSVININLQIDIDLSRHSFVNSKLGFKKRSSSQNSNWQMYSSTIIIKNKQKNAIHEIKGMKLKAIEIPIIFYFY